MRRTIAHNTIGKITCVDCKVPKVSNEFTTSGRTVCGRLHVCRQCMAARARVHYEKNVDRVNAKSKEYTRNNRERINKAAYRRRNADPTKKLANQTVNNAIYAGKFKKQPCRECDNPVADFHHNQGYEPENWFVGIWLCRKHHAAEHKRLRAEKRAHAPDSLEGTKDRTNHQLVDS